MKKSPFFAISLLVCMAVITSCITVKRAEYIYTVTIEEPLENGTITADKNSELAGYEKITLNITPDTGYELDTLTVTNEANGKNVRVDGNVFKMPTGNVTVKATFSKCAEVKSKPDTIGDIVLNDGRVVAYENINSMSNKQKESAVAIIFYIGTECSNNGESRTLGVGLHNGLTETWCQPYANALDKNISSIQCQATGKTGDYTFAGDTDGTDNLEQIATYLRNITNIKDDTAQPEDNSYYGNKNYPAFYFAKNYKDLKYQLPEDVTSKPLSFGSIFGNSDNENLRTPSLGKDYQDGWYLPSIAELFHIWKIKDKVNEISVLCGGSKFLENNTLYVSSSLLNNTPSVGILNFRTGEVSSTEKYKPGTGSNIRSETNQHGVCAIRAF